MFFGNECCQVYFGMLDALLASEELPEEYKNKEQVCDCFLLICFVPVPYDSELKWNVFLGYIVQ